MVTFRSPINPFLKALLSVSWFSRAYPLLFHFVVLVEHSCTFLRKSVREILEVCILLSFFWMWVELQLDIISFQKFDDIVSLSYSFNCYILRSLVLFWFLFWYETPFPHPSGDCRIFFFPSALKCHDIWYDVGLIWTTVTGKHAFSSEKFSWFSEWRNFLYFLPFHFFCFLFLDFLLFRYCIFWINLLVFLSFLSYFLYLCFLILLSGIFPKFYILYWSSTSSKPPSYLPS